MGLLTPLALLFGLTLPVIILLWLLKRRRQEHQVSSTYLWHQVLRDVRANAPWQRLAAQLLLILQLVAAALFALSLARPHLSGPGAGQDHLILVLDASGSMWTEAGGTGSPGPSATGPGAGPTTSSSGGPGAGPTTSSSGGPGAGPALTRFDLARTAAAAQVQALRSRDRVTLIAAGRIPQVLVSAAPPADALAALNQAQATHQTADWVQALSLASSAGRGQPGARISIITDGVVAPATLDSLNLPATATTVAPPAENISIRLSVRSGAAGGSPAALGRLANHGREQATAAVEFLVDGAPIDERQVDLPPGGTAELFWRDLPAGATLFTARITTPDALSLDNQDFAVLQRSGRAKALLVSRANLFLEQAVRLRDDLDLVRSTPENYAPGPYQLYIFDGWAPPELPLGSIFLVNPPPGNPGMPVKAQTTISGITAGSQTNPIVAYVPLEDVHIARARTLDLPTWANPLLEAPEGVLMAAGHNDGRAVAVLGFDIHESDLPLRLGFPVLMQNLMNWLVPQAPAATRVSAGETLPLALDPLTERASIITPDERRTQIAPPLPPAPWSDTAKPGLYTLLQTLPDGERTSRFVVEFPPSESQADGAISVPAGATTADGSSRPPQREIWPWVAGFALLILGAEWWVYIRGT